MNPFVLRACCPTLVDLLLYMVNGEAIRLCRSLAEWVRRLCLHVVEFLLMMRNEVWTARSVRIRDSRRSVPRCR